jgi:SAM-dependent methyltransferase
LSSRVYRGIHGARYDLIYAEKPYPAEAAFVTGLLAEHGVNPGRLLDLACGTGRHAREFGVLGWDVVGIDTNEDLLEAASRNAPSAALMQQDMRELDLGERRFDAVTCLFDSLGYLENDAGIVAMLSRAREHLAPGGAIVIEVLHAAALLCHASPTRIGRWRTSDGDQLLRISEVELDLGNDLMRVSYELFEFDSDGSLRDHGRERHVNRYFTAASLRSLIGTAGLEVADVLAAYDRDRPIDDRVWHLMAIARVP